MLVLWGLPGAGALAEVEHRNSLQHAPGSRTLLYRIVMYWAPGVANFPYDAYPTVVARGTCRVVQEDGDSR